MAKETPVYAGIGRRKESTARVRLKKGVGRIFINKRPIDDYFFRATLRMDLRQPLNLTETQGDMDVFVNVKGGGLTGQAGAVRLGIARALLQLNPDYRGVLKKAGMLTRDARKVERKKYGLAGARRSFQFSKR